VRRRCMRSLRTKAACRPDDATPYPPHAARLAAAQVGDVPPLDVVRFRIAHARPVAPGLSSDVLWLGWCRASRAVRVAAAQASDDAEEDDSMALVKRVQVAHEKLLARGVKTYVGKTLTWARRRAWLHRAPHGGLRAVKQQRPARCGSW
jgi:hypothetical protein